MKRQMGGGAHRGPPGLRRQRRTIRLVQGLLVVLAAALLLFAGYSLARATAEPHRGDELNAPARPPVAQGVVLAILGLGGFAAALLLQDRGGVRLPTPARLDELAGRAEAVALERAEAAAVEDESVEEQPEARREL